ncbi:hypothetical protein SGPA1_40737 [Streptomyces misionensis JCM 4497]
MRGRGAAHGPGQVRPPGGDRRPRSRRGLADTAVPRRRQRRHRHGPGRPAGGQSARSGRRVRTRPGRHPHLGHLPLLRPARPVPGPRRDDPAPRPQRRAGGHPGAADAADRGAGLVRHELPGPTGLPRAPDDAPVHGPRHRDRGLSARPLVGAGRRARRTPALPPAATGGPETRLRTDGVVTHPRPLIKGKDNDHGTSRSAGPGVRRAQRWRRRQHAEPALLCLRGEHAALPLTGR